MKMNKTNRKPTKLNAAQRARKDDKKRKQLVTLDDVQLTHVSGGFCVTPWD